MNATDPGVVRPKVVDRLVLDELPRGRVTRLLVELISDPLGHPVYHPLLVARGRRPGPVFGLTAAVHGNELNGIPVLHKLFERMEPDKLAGTIVGMVAVNIPGIFGQRRLMLEGMDLNHMMPGKPDGHVAQVFAHRLLDRIVRNFNYLVDLHTASFGRVNSLYVRADMGDPVTARMAFLQRPQIILNNPASDRTLRGAAQELGIHSITVEIGDPQRFQPELIKRSLVGLRAVLGFAKMLPKRRLAMGSPPIICEDSYWLYTGSGGLLEVFPKVTQFVEKGEVIARLSNAFGDVIEEYRAPEFGVVIGKSVNPVGYTGARILHLGIPAPEDHGYEITKPSTRVEESDAHRLSGQRGRRARADADDEHADPAGGATGP